MGYIHVWDIMDNIMEIVDITEYIMRKGLAKQSLVFLH